MSMRPAQYVQSGDVSLAVYRWGKPESGPTVLLVHGYPDAAGVWQPVAELLSERNYHVIAYDVRGMGQSTRPHGGENDYNLERLAADFKAVIDEVSPDRAVHLVGHDWGSIQSWEAVVTPELADRIDSFTSISGPSLDHAGEWVAKRLRSGAPEQLSQVARQLGHSWYVGMFHLPVVGSSAWKLGLDRWWPTLLERLEGVRGEKSETQRNDGVHGINLYRANFARRLLKPRARSTEIPVQLICPTQDRFMVSEIWDDLPRWAPRLWRREVDAGHWVQTSHPQLIADYVDEFVQFIEGSEETVALRRARRRAMPQHSGKPHAGKLVVVTGGGSGIGRETALSFAENGADLVILDVDQDGAERTAELVRLFEVEAWMRCVDVGDAKAMEQVAQWVGDELGGADVVVNNAGIGMAGPLLDTAVEDWERILHINLWGVIHGSRLFARQMLDKGRRGHIVNVSSGLAFLPSRATPAYATTKAAVRMLSECLRAELADQGIGVSAVYPGVVNTPIVGRTRFVGVSADEQKRQRGRAQKLYQRRNLKPQAVANAILDAVAHNRPEVLVGVETHALRLVDRLSPELTRRMARLKPV